MHSQLRICPLCNSFMNSGLKVVRCIECGEVFKLDERNNVWRNPNIMDVSYFDPESSVLSILFPHKFNKIYFPVEPKPPSPRAVSLNSVTTSIFACSTRAIIICATLSSGWIVYVSFERFTIGTQTSPL